MVFSRIPSTEGLAEYLGVSKGTIYRSGDGKIYVRGKLIVRGSQKQADYILYYKPNISSRHFCSQIQQHSVRAGIQQAFDEQW